MLKALVVGVVVLMGCGASPRVLPAIPDAGYPCTPPAGLAEVYCSNPSAYRTCSAGKRCDFRGSFESVEGCPANIAVCESESVMLFCATGQWAHGPCTQCRAYGPVQLPCD